jgi:hypothetical protein
MEQWQKDGVDSDVKGGASEAAWEERDGISSQTKIPQHQAALKDTLHADKRPKLQLPCKKPWISESIIKIITATYGPCETLCTDTAGSGNPHSDSIRIPFTRDCAPFLIKLLRLAREKEEGPHNKDVDRQFSEADSRQPLSNGSKSDEDDTDNEVRLKATVDGKSQAFVSLLGGGGKWSMNALFGDPCPGTSKKLMVHYTVTALYGEEQECALMVGRMESHTVSFAEHEPVKLRRQLAVINGAPIDEDNEAAMRTLDRTPGSAGKDRNIGAGTTLDLFLPLVLPFLVLGERIQCRVICKTWKKVIQEWGVATTIDANDPRTTNTGNQNNHQFTRPVLRGLLAHSYNSLHSLFLSGFQQLEKQDLHPALAQLQSLRTLDVSKCTNLDDSTMKLISEHLSGTLQVLYLKGLHRVSDKGLKAICRSCAQLEVLDLSQVIEITDTGGTAVKSLKKLRALFLRDNFQLTNESIDAITENCVKLRQLTLWGLIRIDHFQFPKLNSGRLVILNLWGCHSLGDDTAAALETMQLKSLILTECHKLSDDFILGISRLSGLKGLQHLHLRYLIKLSDKSLQAIAENFGSLHSLDLSFCSGITAYGIYQLLHHQRENLVELRLKSIRNLEIAYQAASNSSSSISYPFRHAADSNTIASPRRNDRRNHGGHWILNALRPLVHSTVDHTLCVLDVRQCGGQPDVRQPYDDRDQFVVGMSKLRFAQAVPGFFTRYAVMK